MAPAPEALVERARRIPGTAAVHIPKSMRERVGAALADCIEGTLADDPQWGIRLELLPKLLLFAVPKGISATVELGQRFSAWEHSRWDELVSRIELQGAGAGSGPPQEDVTPEDELRAVAAGWDTSHARPILILPPGGLMLRGGPVRSVRSDCR